MQASNSFGDLDQPDIYANQLAALLRPDSRNFAVCFNADRAESRINLEPDDVADFFDQDNNSEGQVRWLNFWSWDSGYKPAFEKIAQKYKISPRLVALIWPRFTPEPVPEPKVPSEVHSSSSSTNDSKTSDLERGAGIRRKWTQFMHKDHAPPRPKPMPKTGFGNIAENLWHFCSVDSGAEYIHIGFNQLFVPPLSGGQSYHADSDKPTGIRIWTSILLCADGTVISVFEPPPVGLRIDPLVLKVLRRNILNIFRNLSRLHRSSPEEEMFKVSIRQPKPESDDLPPGYMSKAQASMSSLLFYYIFDDWFSSYALISRREHPYRKRLEDIRGDMFKAAGIDSIHHLHQIGRQLGVLKLMYHAYELIVSRLMSSQRVREHQSQPNSQNSFNLGEYSSFDYDNDNGGSGGQVPLNRDRDRDRDAGHGSRVKLSTSSLVRFERLLDRIRLYALTEIDNCLKEKEELVFMNFNLITLSESHTVEKLTRTTILLAKVSVVFLPLGLLTSYFGISMNSIDELYSLTTYWVAFAVVASLTLIYLVFYELASSKVGHGIGYKSLTKFLWEKGKRELDDHHHEMHHHQHHLQQQPHYHEKE